jgi:hypothetical protein
MCTSIKPFIKCIDYWPEHIPPEKLAAYKQLIDEGQIRKHHVIYNRTAGSTTVEYYAIAPHEWILEELKRRASNETGCGLSASALVD